MDKSGEAIHADGVSLVLVSCCKRMKTIGIMSWHSTIHQLKVVQTRTERDSTRYSETGISLASYTIERRHSEVMTPQGQATTFFAPTPSSIGI